MGIDITCVLVLRSTDTELEFIGVVIFYGFRVEMLCY